MRTQRRLLNVYFTIALVSACFLILPVSAGSARSAQEPSSSQKDSLERFLRDYLSDIPADEKTSTTTYSSAFVDLKDDGKREVIVYIAGRHLCGSSGCSTLVLAPEGSSFKIVTSVAIGWPPIRVLASKTNGWHDLGIWVAGGGTELGYESKLSFNGRSYPSNPSVPPARRASAKTPGEIVVPEAAKGTPLF